MSGSVARGIGRVATVLMVLTLGVAAVLAYQNRQEISDFFAAQRFTPTAEIAQLTERLDPTDRGERVFFASTPTLDGSQHFNELCSDVDHVEGGHVLGCFSDGRIHLFNVTDERLTGIVEVTAAHELLHAAFSRLDTAAKEHLAARLDSVYADLSAGDPELVARMSVYEHLPPLAFANELHSVLGTEVRVLPSWLETHYTSWFSNRSAIVDHFDAYHHVFVALQQRADELHATLTTMRADIEARRAEYDAAVAMFNSDWNTFIARNDAFEFSDNPEQFYAIRDAFDTRRDQLNAELNALNADIAVHEELRLELLQLADLNTELQDILNSELAPPAATPTP